MGAELPELAQLGEAPGGADDHHGLVLAEALHLAVDVGAPDGLLDVLLRAVAQDALRLWLTNGGRGGE